VHVVGCEAALGLGGLGDGLVEVALLRLNAIEDAGFVEMDVGLDKAGRDQAAGKINGFAFGREFRLDDGNAARRNADVGQPLLGADSSGISENEIHDLPYTAAVRRHRLDRRTRLQTKDRSQH
jgi:hypothetical protein